MNSDQQAEEDKVEEKLNELLECDIPEVIDSNNPDSLEDQTVFLNPTTQDTLLSNLVSGNYNSIALNRGSTAKSSTLTAIKKEQATETAKQEPSTNSQDLAVAKKDAASLRLNSPQDLDIHLESTQTELEQLKDILNGCSSFDAKALLGLFSDESLPYELSYAQGSDDVKSDGLELATLGNNADIIDFASLLDDSSDVLDNPEYVSLNTDPLMSSTSDLEVLNTPQITSNAAPIFQASKSSKFRSKSSGGPK